MSTPKSSIPSGICCPSCGDIYLDPRILPCGKSICSECIPDQDDEFECQLCSKKHTRTAEGEFLHNESLASIVDQSLQAFASGKDLSSRNYAIKIIRESIKELRDQSKYMECETRVEENYASVNNAIDLKTECLLESVRIESQKLKDKVKVSRETSISELSTRFKASGEKVTSLEKEVADILKSDKPRDQVTESLKPYMEHLRVESNKLEELSKKQTVVHFVASNDQMQVNLGTIINNYQKVENGPKRIDLTRIFQSKDVSTNEIDSFQVISFGQYSTESLVLAYKHVKRSIVYICFLDSEFNCVSTEEVKDTVDYQDFKLYKSGNKNVVLAFNYEDRFEIRKCKFRWGKSDRTVEVLKKSLKKTKCVEIKIAHFEQLVNSFLIVCHYFSRARYCELRAEQSYVFEIKEDFQQKSAKKLAEYNPEDDIEEICKCSSMRVHHSKMWVLDSDYNLIAYHIHSLYDPIEKIRGHPFLRDIGVDPADGFLIDSQENFIFFVGWPHKVKKAVYVSQNMRVVFTQELNDLDLDHFFIDGSDIVHLVDAKQLVVYKFRKN